MYVFKEKDSEELIRMGIAPIKRDYWLEHIRKNDTSITRHTPASSRDEPKLKLSKRQAKKARNEGKKGAVCFNFAKGACKAGEDCKFSHDVDAFLTQKPPDLPGQCPYSLQVACPYGLLCRWAASHKLACPSRDRSQENGSTDSSSIQDELRSRQTLKLAAQDLPASSIEDEGIDGDARIKNQEEGIAISKPDQAPEPLISKDRSEVVDEKKREAVHADQSSHMIGTAMNGSFTAKIQPGMTVELPVLPAEGPVSNLMDKDLQQKLWRKKYDFSEADRLIQIIKQMPKSNPVGKSSRQHVENMPQIGEDGTLANCMPEGIACSAEMQPMKRQRTEGTAEGSTIMEEPLHADSTTKKLSQSVQDEPYLTRSSSLADTEMQKPKACHSQSHQGEPVSVPVPDGDMPNSLGKSESFDDTFIDTPLRAKEKARLDLKGKLYLAPLTTVGNLPFRRICKRLGADVTCGEMAVATNLLQGQASEWALLKRHPCEDLFGVQICGGFTDSMIRCATLVEANVNVDFVDINMGCPIDLICAKNAGSALLLKPHRMQEIVRGMSASLTCPLTVKLRRGYTDGADVAHQLLPHLESWGAVSATLHGRSREQRYSRLADWDYIGRCVEAAGTLPLVGNGDIFSFTDYQLHVSACPNLATTMIARGAIIKPWLFTEIKESRHWDISAGERFELLKTFCSAGLLHWGSDTKGVETTRRFLLEWLSYLCRYIPVGLLDVIPQHVRWRAPYFFGRNDLETLLASQEPSDWVAISERLLGPSPPGFVFKPKHKSNAYSASEQYMSLYQENG